MNNLNAAAQAVPGLAGALTADKIRALIATVQAMAAQGATEHNNAEYAHIVGILRAVHQNSQAKQLQQQQQQQQQLQQQLGAQAGSAVNAQQLQLLQQQLQQQQQQAALAQNSVSAVAQPATVAAATPATKKPVATDATSSAAAAAAAVALSKEHSSFSETQIKALQNQIAAFQLIARNKEVPEPLQRTIYQLDLANQKTASVTTDDAGEKMPAAAAKITDTAHAFHSNMAKSMSIPASGAASTTPVNRPSGMATYTDPYAYMQQRMSYHVHASRQQRLLIPAVVPTGLSPFELAQERERRIRSRVQYRIQELESLPSNIGDAPFDGGFAADDSEHSDRENGTSAGAKIRALIELRALRLLDRQRNLRDELIRGMRHATTLATAADRAAYRRQKRQSLREARMTERLERQQRADRERRMRQKHIDYLQTIVTHGREMQNWHRAQQRKQTNLARLVLQQHATMEREEQKRAERAAKERLRALKADDEETYLKLVSEAKNGRLKHLLEQTDSYLEALASAVKEQQSSVGAIADVGAYDELEEDNERIDYYGVAHRIREKVTEQPNMLVGGTLKEYQIRGLEWMASLYNNRLNGILADEMGLGKTIQTISLITFLIEKKRQNGPFLIIVPLSTLTNWRLEFEKWAPSVSIVVYRGPPGVRRDIQQNEIRHGNFQVLLTTYEFVIKDKPVLSKIKWIHMIIDEGHRMKNTQSRLTTTLTTAYTSRHRLILTGTPLQNNLPELWALLNFILPRIFNSVKGFDEWFSTPFANQGGQERIELNEEESILIIKRLHKVLRPFLLRRLKKDVESELPDKVETVIKCRLSSLQQALYHQVRTKGCIRTVTGTEKGKPGKRGLSNTLMQLRKVCNHPYVFREVETDVSPDHLFDENLFRTSGKFELLDRILPKLFRSGHRVLLFFQMTEVMTIMMDYMHYRGYKCLRLDGTTKSEERSDMLKVFNASDSPYQAFLLSTRAGGLGLNLQTADTVIIFDSDWNPHQDLQAQDRAHRIGQTKEVRILRLITVNSIEENILARANYKLDLDGKVIQAGKFDNKSTEADREAFLRNLLEDSSAGRDEAEEDLEDDDNINEMIARSDDELNLFRQMDEERKAEELRVWRGMGKTGEPRDRLIQLDELPAIYSEEHVTTDEEDMEDYGRGQRARDRVFYDDGLTDEQFADAIENNEIDLQDVIERKRNRKMARENRKQTPHTQNNEEEVVASVQHTPARRGRPPKTPRSIVADEQAADSPGASARRGRKRKAELEAPDSDSSAQHTPLTAGKKRRGRQPGLDKLPELLSAEERHRLTEACMSVLDRMRGEINTEYDPPMERSQIFEELPSRAEWREYYNVIKSPMSLAIIEKRIHSPYYRNLDGFRQDCELMFNNATSFNIEGSQVYLDALYLMKMVNAMIAEMQHGRLSQSAPEPTTMTDTAIAYHEDTPDTDTDNPFTSHASAGPRTTTLRASAGLEEDAATDDYDDDEGRSSFTIRFKRPPTVYNDASEDSADDDDDE